ncbi:hypothetical protein BsWGS_13317 [Bradybaena similaris]
MYSTFRLDNRARDEITLIGKHVWRAGQSQTDAHLTITRCFRDEGLNAVRRLWQDQNGLCSVLDNSSECHSGRRGGIEVDWLQPGPAREEAEVTACPLTGVVTRDACPRTGVVTREACPRTGVVTREACPRTGVVTREACPRTGVVTREACPRTGVVTREAWSEVCPIDVANNEAAGKVCHELDVVNRKSIARVFPELDLADRESMVKVCPELDLADRESMVKVFPELDLADRESMVKVCPELDLADRESIVRVYPELDVVDRKLIVEVCHELDVVDRNSIVEVSLQSEAENWESGVKMCRQSDPDNKELRMTVCYSHMKDIDRPQETTLTSQDNNKVNGWRKGGCLCHVQQLSRRRSRLQANSRIKTRKRHIVLAAWRHVKFACDRRRKAAASENRNTTRLSQSAGLSQRDQLRMKRSSTTERLVPRCVHKLMRSERLHCYFLNVNTNAGITDTSDKADTKQASCTSVHSSDQYYSAPTDTPDARVVDSDNEVSPAFSFTEDAADKLATSPHSNPDPVLSKSCDQVMALRHLDNKDKRTELIEMKDRGQRKNGGEARSDESVDVKAGKCCRANQGATSLQDDYPSNKHKKKSKTTETVYIKFESSMSKKVTTTTTVLKDAKRPGTNKSRSDTHKQLLQSEDVHKAIASVPEKLDNRVLVDTPRHTKIVRGLEARQGSPDPLVKYNDDIISVRESAPQKTGQNVARATESDDYLPHFETPPLAAYTSGTLRNASSLSERLTPPRSPTKSRSPQSGAGAKVDVLDSDYASERESSAATIVNVPKVSPRPKVASIKEGKEQMIRPDNINKMDKAKQFDSNLKEVKQSQEKRDQPKHLSPTKEPGCTSLDKGGHDHSQTSALHVSKPQSPKVDIFTSIETPRKRTTTKHKGDSPHKKSSVDITAKNGSKKIVASKARSRTTDGLSTKEDICDHSKGKAAQQALTSSRKRSPIRTKTQSRSPDSKRRKRSAKKSADTKGSKSPECLKSDKSKKSKSADKTLDKKKKKKRQKQKSTSKSEADSSDKVSSGKKVGVSTRSRSSESSKTPQTLPSFTSASQSAEAGALIQVLSPITLWKGDEGKLPQQGDKVSGGVDRDSSAKPRETKCKNRAASSAENVSMCEGTPKPIRAAESVPTFTGTVYTSITKVVQVASCPKTKKSEKDLQQAELGWNSSKASAEEKNAAEKIKQNQRKVKARYYLMKTKARSAEYEPVRLRRAIALRNQADGDNGTREIGDKSDAPQAEKTKSGQGKSVQFSESTEDHEASRDEIVDGYSAFPDSLDSDGAGNKFTIVLQPSGKSVVLTQPITKLTAVSLATGKASAETPKPLNKSDVDGLPAANKATIQKKEEARSQTTPPRKRRPIWHKKVLKEKAPPTTKGATAAVKSVPALASIKQRQSSDNILKPAARPLMACSYPYPGKLKMQSPSLSNMSLDDKRTVAYNTWINGNIPAAPMNKAARKLVAQTGSPVDIKEIIEGSSVDAKDYHRSMRALHELGLRTTKSVPPIGARRSTSTDVLASKRMKLQQTGHKKTKVRESSSARSLSSVDGLDEQGLTSKYRSSGRDASVSPTSSTDVDNGPSFKCRTGSHRFADQVNHRKKKEKHGKKFAKDGSGKWRLVDAQDVHSVPDLTRVQYYGDVTDINTLNMGLSWVVQNVFGRLPFLSQRPASANASGDMSVRHLGE